MKMTTHMLAVIGAAGLAHLIGDYLIQSHWMANVKTRRSLEGWVAAIAHGVTYTLPFLFLTTSLPALAVIAGTHIVIDHWRLARYVVWGRNQLAPTAWRPKLTATGAPDETPPWLSFWLLFIADNVLHMAINLAAIWWL
jgi:hypothetical protein